MELEWRVASPKVGIFCLAEGEFGEPLYTPLCTSVPAALWDSREGLGEEGMEVEMCHQPIWMSPFRRGSEASSATAWTAAISTATAASTPGKRGSGQKQQERTLKADVSQPSLPPPLGGERGQEAQNFLEPPTQGRRNLL